MKSSDAYLVQVLDLLETLGLRESTVVVRPADHGETGMPHGGMRQKNFKAYEEALRVPLVFSNPRLYPELLRCEAPVSHVVSLREPRWKIARYFDVNGVVPPWWEMYDLRHDPDERVNLAGPDHPRTDAEEAELRRLQARLEEVERTRPAAPLAPAPALCGGAPSSPAAPAEQPAAT